MSAPQTNYHDDPSDVLTLTPNELLHKCFVSPNIPFLKAIIQSGSFWKYFSRLSTCGDGHCLVYSLMKSFKSQHDIECNYCDILNQIRKETNDHMLSYKQLINIDTDLEMQRLLCAYLDGKNFDTLFGDLLPMILSNIFNTNIVIIHRVGNSIDPILIVPRISCNSFVYVYKSGDHYEGFETVCCFGSSIGTLDTMECRSKNTRHDSTQVEPPNQSGMRCSNVFTRTNVTNRNCIKPRLTVWNIYGLTEYKLDVNEDFLRKSTVIIALETWSRGDIAGDVFPGYKYFDFFRRNQHVNSVRGAGGIVVYSICISLGSPSRQPSFYQISNLHGILNYQKLFIPYEKLSNLRNIDLDYSRIMSGNVHHRTPF